MIDTLGVSPAELRAARSFAELGVDSLLAVRLLEAINVAFDLHEPTSVMFEFHDTQALAAHLETRGARVAALPAEAAVALAGVPAARADSRPAGPALEPGAGHEGLPGPSPEALLPGTQPARNGIAVVGMACRCAGAQDPAAFWKLVARGEIHLDSVAARRPAWGEYLAAHEIDAQSLRAGFADDIDAFDPLFFDISPVQAEQMDASQRVLLEGIHAAIEDAGYDPASLAAREVGTFIGSMGVAGADSLSHHAMLGNDGAILSSRIAYHLNLSGPAMTVNTACSSAPGRDLAGLRQASCRRAGHGDRGRHHALHAAGFLRDDAQCRHAVAERRLPPVRRRRRRHRGGRRHGRGGADAGRAGARRGRARVRRDPRDRHQPGRQDLRHHRAELPGAEPPGDAGLSCGAAVARCPPVRRGARYRHPARRSGRAACADRGVSRFHRAAEFLRDRLGEGQYRPCHGCGRRARADQGAAGDAPCDAAAGQRLRAAEPARRFRGEPVPCRDAGAALAARRGRDAPRGTQCLRFQRDQCPPGSRGRSRARGRRSHRGRAARRPRDRAAVGAPARAARGRGTAAAGLPRGRGSAQRAGRPCLDPAGRSHGA